MGFPEATRRVDDLARECADFSRWHLLYPCLGPESQGTGEMAKYRVVREEVLKMAPDLVEEVHAPTIESRTG